MVSDKLPNITCHEVLTDVDTIPEQCVIFKEIWFLTPNTLPQYCFKAIDFAFRGFQDINYAWDSLLSTLSLLCVVQQQ